MQIKKYLGDSEIPTPTYTHKYEVYEKDTESTWRVPNGQNWDNLSNKRRKVELGYNPVYKISMYEYLQILINDWMNECMNEWIWDETNLLRRRILNNLCR